jgi:hypothetical protein
MFIGVLSVMAIVSCKGKEETPELRLTKLLKSTTEVSWKKTWWYFYKRKLMALMCTKNVNKTSVNVSEGEELKLKITIFKVKL